MKFYDPETKNHYDAFDYAVLMVGREEKLKEQNRNLSHALTKYHEEIMKLKHARETDTDPYIIVTDHHIGHLSKAVSKHMEAGYRPVGGVCATGHGDYYQAMVWEGNNG